MNEHDIQLPDGGNSYMETDPSRLIVEPYNAASALLFLGIASYWFYRLRHAYAHQIFLSISSAFLMIGAIGGTIYHAFRISRFFILMDWLPILILCLMAGWYFLSKTLKNGWKAIGVIILFFIVQGFTWQYAGIRDPHTAININYGLMGMMVLFPVFIYLWRTNFQNWGYIALALLCFICALLFRIVDKDHLLPMGTHFLWHVFGAGACHLMFLFINRTYELPPPNRRPIFQNS